MNRLMRKLSKNLNALFGIFIICAFFIPYMILGTDSIIELHDNLDGYFVNKVLLSHLNGWGVHAEIPQVMNGLPVSALPTKLSVSQLFYSVFHPFSAYMINELFIRVIGYLGMYLLLRKHILKTQNHYLAIGIASIFALLQIYSIFDLSVMGQPLVLYSFLCLRNLENKPVFNYLILIFFGIYSSLVLSGLFILVLVSVFFIYDVLKAKTFNVHFFYGIALLSLVYVIVEYRMFYAIILDSDFISHRSEAYKPLPVLSNRVKDLVIMLLKGQYHAARMNTILIVFSYGLSIVIPLEKVFSLKDYVKHFFIYLRTQRKYIYLIMMVIVFISLFYLISPYVIYWLSPYIGIFNSINIERFYFLLPTAFLLLFSLSLERIEILLPKWFVIVLLFVQIGITLNNDLYLRNVISIINGKKIDTEISYDSFFSHDIFSSIDSAIARDKSSYKIVSIGLHPSIAIFNGFYTLDSYQSSYSLSYKHEFRKIISSELEKSSRWKYYFDYWGNRCYVFSSELNSLLISKNEGIKIKNLQINTEQMKKMGCEYIFSAVPIENYSDLGLGFNGCFTTDNSYYSVYLYRL